MHKKINITKKSLLPGSVACIVLLLGVTKQSPMKEDIQSAAANASDIVLSQERSDESVDSVVQPNRPINCEDFQAYLDAAIITWTKVRGTYLIVVARLGTRESSRALNISRLKYLEEYLDSHGVKYLLAESDRIKGLGRIEIYVGGVPRMLIPIKRGSKAVCSGSTG